MNPGLELTWRASQMASNSSYENPKPFLWTANPEKIIAGVKRGHQALDSIH
jgi:hypothetical protein